jgi:hypothetical protein
MKCCNSARAGKLCRSCASILCHTRVSWDSAPRLLSRGGHLGSSPDSPNVPAGSSPHCDVLYGSIVPERHGIRLPVEAHLECRLGAVREQKVEYGAALLRRQFIDVRGEPLVDEQCLALRYWMSAHDRMHRLRKYPVTVVDPKQPVGASIDVVARMGRGEAVKEGFEGRAECIIRRTLAREDGIAAGGWHGVEIKNTAEWRLDVAGYIRMPILTAMSLEFASAWIGRTSGCPSGPGVFGWMCSLPKCRPSAFCWSRLISWSRKNST